MTVRYCPPSALVGVVSRLACAISLTATIQAVDRPRAVALGPSVVQRAAQRDARVACAARSERSIGSAD
jgi:hypothetical protein